MRYIYIFLHDRCLCVCVCVLPHEKYKWFCLFFFFIFNESKYEKHFLSVFPVAVEGNIHLNFEVIWTF